LFSKISNIYVFLILISTVWLGLIGFIDDYIKVFRKNKEGLSGKFKIIGQVGLGLIVGAVLYFNSDVVIQREIISQDKQQTALTSEKQGEDGKSEIDEIQKDYVNVKTPITTIPFVRKHEFNYAKLISWISPNAKNY